MTQRELEREISRATGETSATVRQRGFGLLEPRSAPLTVDWDELALERMALLPCRSARRKVASR